MKLILCIALLGPVGMGANARPPEPVRILITEPDSAKLVVKTVEGRCGSQRFEVVYAPSLASSRE
jgi:hypothetical protein